MRCSRFAVLAFWGSLAGLLAVPLGPTSAPVAVITSVEVPEPCLAKNAATYATIEPDTLLSVDIATSSSSRLSAPGTSRFVATATLGRVPRPTLSARADRAPPIA